MDRCLEVLYFGNDQTKVDELKFIVQIEYFVEVDGSNSMSRPKEEVFMGQIMSMRSPEVNIMSYSVSSSDEKCEVAVSLPWGKIILWLFHA